MNDLQNQVQPWTISAKNKQYAVQNLVQVSYSEAEQRSQVGSIISRQINEISLHDQSRLIEQQRNQDNKLQQIKIMSKKDIVLNLNQLKNKKQIIENKPSKLKQGKMSRIQFLIHAIKGEDNISNHTNSNAFKKCEKFVPHKKKRDNPKQIPLNINMNKLHGSKVALTQPTLSPISSLARMKTLQFCTSFI